MEAIRTRGESTRRKEKRDVRRELCLGNVSMTAVALGCD